MLLGIEKDLVSKWENTFDIHHDLKYQDKAIKALFDLKNGNTGGSLDVIGNGREMKKRMNSERNPRLHKTVGKNRLSIIEEQEEEDKKELSI